MKKLFTPLFILAAAFFFVPQAAEARSHHHGAHRYVSGHASCGCAIYTKRVVRSYDCDGRPIYAYYRQPLRHTCHARRSSIRVQHGYGHNYGHRYSRRSYGNYGSCGTRSGISINYGGRW